MRVVCCTQRASCWLPVQVQQHLVTLARIRFFVVVTCRRLVAGSLASVHGRLRRGSFRPQILRRYYAASVPAQPEDRRPLPVAFSAENFSAGRTCGLSNRLHIRVRS
eukprot:COSAG06_NODE_20665_length_786_cov_0.902475_1_plen_106_part_10